MVVGCIVRMCLAPTDGMCGCISFAEARPGIEPGCEDLQSSTSPLRHRASTSEAAKCVGEGLVSTLLFYFDKGSLGVCDVARYKRRDRTSVLHG